MRIENRLARLEAKQGNDYMDVMEWIKNGAYYDELTPKQRSRYVEYYGLSDTKSFEDIHLFIYTPKPLYSCPLTEKERNTLLHFKLEKRKPLAKEISAETRREIEEYFKDFDEEYNSSEAQAERRAWYEEIQRIGELRKEAFARGESMDKYPLPFELKITEEN